MLRNAFGVLLPWEAALVLVIIYATAFALLALGIRLFRTGSISYDARLDLRKVLSSRREST
jgi:ABC-2 type transport system permease protein